MGLVHSVFSACTHCWDAGDTHIVITPSGGWAHTHARPKILFYDKHKPYYEFTNFSPHEVVYEGKRYPTSEHLFQAFKVSLVTSSSRRWRRRDRESADAVVFGQFLDGHPQIAERIRTCGPKPITAFDEAHRHKTAIRSDWSKVHVSKVCPRQAVFLLETTTHVSNVPMSTLDGNSAEPQVHTTSTSETDAPRYW